MNFFNNLYNSVTGALGNAYNWAAGGINSLTNSISNNLSSTNNPNNSSYTASVANAGLNPGQTVYYTPSGQSYQPTQNLNAYSVPAGIKPGTPEYNAFVSNPTSRPTTISGVNYGTQPVLPSLVQTGNYGAYGGMPRPMIQPTASTANQTQQGVQYGGNQVDQYGRVSNSNVGNAYRDTQGNMVIPKQGFSGFIGEGGGGLMSSAPAQGTSGMPGGSSFTGNLGAAGLYSSSPLGSSFQSEEEKVRDKKFQDLFSIGAGSSAGKAGAQNALGLLQQMQNTPPLSVLTPNKSPAPMSTPVIQPTQNVTNLTKQPNPVLGTPMASSINDVETTNKSIQTNYQTAMQTLDQQYPPNVPYTTDTQEQIQFMEQSGDPFGIKAALDAFKASETNLASLEGERISVMKSIKALNEAYNPIIQDIKNNPDLPKGLARRRLEDLNTKQKEVLMGFTNQLELLNQSIGDQNQMVNRRFNIVQFASSQANQAQDNARQMLTTLVSTGAIGGMSDQELEQLARMVGVNIGGLKTARKNANDPAKDIITETDANGNVRGIDRGTGKVVWQLAGVGKPSSSTANNQFTDTQINKGAVNAGVDINTFGQYPADVQNLFINNQPLAGAFNVELNNYKKGETSKQEIEKLINDLPNVPTNSKNGLLQIVNSTQVTTPQTNSGGFFNNVWNGLVNWWNS